MGWGRGKPAGSLIGLMAGQAGPPGPHLKLGPEAELLAQAHGLNPDPTLGWPTTGRPSQRDGAAVIRVSPSGAVAAGARAPVSMGRRRGWLGEKRSEEVPKAAMNGRNGEERVTTGVDDAAGKEAGREPEEAAAERHEDRA